MPRKRKVPIADEYEYRLHQRTGWAADQLPAAAMGGDREALARCAGFAAVLVEKRTPDPQHAAVIEWLVYALAQIQAGAEPNDAFGWTRGQGRPPEFRALQRDFRIGCAVELLVTRDNMTPEQAAGIVAAQYSRSVEHALTCYKALARR
jgi:hypothetical protein